MRPRSDSGVLRIVKWNFDVPLEAARSFVDDMRAYHAEKIGPKRDGDCSPPGVAPQRAFAEPN